MCYNDNYHIFVWFFAHAVETLIMAYGSTRGLGAYGPEIDKHMKSSKALDFDSLNL